MSTEAASQDLPIDPPIKLIQIRRQIDLLENNNIISRISIYKQLKADWASVYENEKRYIAISRRFASYVVFSLSVWVLISDLLTEASDQIIGIQTGYINIGLGLAVIVVFLAMRGFGLLFIYWGFAKYAFVIGGILIICGLLSCFVPPALANGRVSAGLDDPKGLLIELFPQIEDFRASMNQTLEGLAAANQKLDIIVGSQAEDEARDREVLDTVRSTAEKIGLLGIALAERVPGDAPAIPAPITTLNNSYFTLVANEGAVIEGNIATDIAEPNFQRLQVASVSFKTYRSAILSELNMAASLPGDYGTFSIETDGDFRYDLWSVIPAAGNYEVFTTTVVGADGTTATRNLYVTIARADGLGTDAPDRITGSDGSDQISGVNAGDWLYGMEGNDMLDGGAGNDTVEGGSGDDVLEGGAGNDLLIGRTENDSLKGGEGNDDLYGDGGQKDEYIGDDNLFGEGGHDLLEGGKGDDKLDGGSGNDDLYGSDGNDTLSGGPGADYLIGESGNDVLIGGDGPDLFWFYKDTDASDIIIDFSAEERDKLELSNVITAFEAGEDNIEDFVFAETSGTDTDIFAINGIEGERFLVARLANVRTTISRLYSLGLIIH